MNAKQYPTQYLTQYLTADETIAELGISKATLYSYVSRGLIHSEEVGGKTRVKRYWGEDVARLKQRKEQRRNPAQAAANALHFGDPVLESAITLIADGHCYYRGHLAVDLAHSHRFEAVATLLWTGDFADEALFADAMQLPLANLPSLTQSQAQHVHAVPAEAFQLALLAAAPADLAAYHYEATAVMRTGVRILHLLTHVVTGEVAGNAMGESGTGSIAQRLQHTWQPAAPELRPLLDSILILCADHELNISSFTARCVASAGSTPYAAVVAALAALQGYRHGGAGERVAALLREAAPDPQRAIRDRLRRGEVLPGFGHLLYPSGDPRGKLLLEMAHRVRPDAPVLAVADAIIDMVAQATQLAPNLDFGLVTLAHALELPPHAPFTLFALGRTAGWIGHIIEQYGLDQMIRPRSRYVGV